MNLTNSPTFSSVVHFASTLNYVVPYTIVKDSLHPQEAGNHLHRADLKQLTSNLCIFEITDWRLPYLWILDFFKNLIFKFTGVSGHFVKCFHSVSQIPTLIFFHFETPRKWHLWNSQKNYRYSKSDGLIIEYSDEISDLWRFYRYIRNYR